MRPDHRDRSPSGLARFLRGRWHAGVDNSSSRRQLTRSLRTALDDAGVTSVKLGQQLSTRRALLTAEFVQELTMLQDAAAPIPWHQMESALARALGCPLWEVSGAIDPKPITSASIAQMHAGRLLDGSEVVVKLQRPGIDRVVERDLDILTRLARTLESRTDWGTSMGLQDLASGFSDALREELDFTTERDTMRSIAAGLADGPRPGVRIPTPKNHVSSRRVLVMDQMCGTPLGTAQSVLVGRPHEEPGMRYDRPTLIARRLSLPHGEG